MTNFADPDAPGFLRCRECCEAFPWQRIQATRFDDDPTDADADRDECPVCGNDTFDRQERATRVVREWTYRGRTCEVHRHYMGHYTGYTEFTDADREAGYYVENETLHLPDGDTYTPHGGVTWTTTDKFGFDAAHSFDVCVTEAGDPWGPIGRRYYELYIVRQTSDAQFPAQIWTLEDVAVEVEELADCLPHRLG